MKKKLTTVLTALAVILITGTFAVAQTATIQTGNEFPYFLFGCLALGGMIIVSLKNKFEQLYVSEAIGVFALYTVLVSLFTNPIIDMVKTFVS